MRTLLIATLSILARAAAFAAEPQPECPTPIKVGFYGCCYFYQQDRGIDVEILRTLAERSGCEFSSTYMPRARVWHDMALAHLDMTTMGIETPERDEFAWFLGYLQTKYLAVYRPSQVSIKSLEQIAAGKMTIGMVRSFRHGAAIDAMIDDLKDREPDRIVEVRDEMALFRLLAAGRVQVVFAEMPLFDYAVRQLKIDDAVTLDVAPDEPPAVRALTLSKARFNQTEVAKWRALLDGMRQDGTIDRILRRYLPADEVRNTSLAAPYLRSSEISKAASGHLNPSAAATSTTIRASAAIQPAASIASSAGAAKPLW